MPLRLCPPEANPTAAVARAGPNPVSNVFVARVKPLAAVALAGASLVAAVGAGCLFFITAHDAWSAISAAGPADPADGILLVVAALGAFLSMWLGLGISVSALAALPGALGQTSTVLAARIAPAAARTAVGLILGTTLTAAIVPGTAFADTGGTAPIASSQIAFGGLVDLAPDASFRLVSDAGPAADAAPPPSWFPDKATSAARSSSERQSSHTGQVAVHRGDTLWSIAAHRLGARATSSEIDTEWHRWFAANRKVIGADANAIEPGQLLSPPAPLQVRS
jgi:hypothetical protein